MAGEKRKSQILVNLPTIDVPGNFLVLFVVVFKLMVGRSSYRKPLLCLLFFESFTERLNNARGEFGSLYALWV